MTCVACEGSGKNSNGRPCPICGGRTAATRGLSAISLWQPWASLVAWGVKGTETRDKATPHRGELAIHAAKADNPETKAALARFKATYPELDFDGLPRGAVVALVELVDCQEVSEGDAQLWGELACAPRPLHPGPDQQQWDDVQCGNYGPGRSIWQLAKVRMVDPPVPLTGRQWLWTLSPEEERLVRERATSPVQPLRDRRAGTDGAHALFPEGVLDPPYMEPPGGMAGGDVRDESGPGDDVGGVERSDRVTPLPEPRLTARFSPCRTWRYELGRYWNPALPVLYSVGLNPSVANERRNDPTITREVGYAKAWGFGALVKFNLFARVSTDPKALRAVSRAEAIGPENDAVFASEFLRGETVLCGWGAHGRLHDRDVEVLQLLARAGAHLVAIGTNKDGTPVHPLYQKKDADAFPYDGKKRWLEAGLRSGKVTIHEELPRPDGEDEEARQADSSDDPREELPPGDAPASPGHPPIPARGRWSLCSACEAVAAGHHAPCGRCGALVNFAEDGAIVGPPQPQGLRTTTGCGIKPDPRPALYAPEEALPDARPEPTTVVNLLTGDYDVYAGRRGRGFEGALGNYEGDLEAYERAFLERVESDQAFRARVLACRGLRLGCFCCDWRPGLPASIEKRLQCHAIVIAKWINAQPEGDHVHARSMGEDLRPAGRPSGASRDVPEMPPTAGLELPRHEEEALDRVPEGPAPGARARGQAGSVGDELRRIANDPNSAFSRMVRYAYGLPRERDLNEWPGDGMPPPGPEPDDDPILEVALAQERGSVHVEAQISSPKPEQGSDRGEHRWASDHAGAGPDLLAPRRDPQAAQAQIQVGDLRWLEENVSTSQRRETRWTLCEIVWVTDQFPCQRPDPSSPAGASRSAPGQLVEGKPVQIKGKKATKGKRLSETLLRCPASRAYVERPPLTEWEAKRRAKRKAKKAGEAAVGPLFEREGVYDAGIGDGG